MRGKGVTHRRTQPDDTREAMKKYHFYQLVILTLLSAQQIRANTQSKLFKVQSNPMIYEDYEENKIVGGYAENVKDCSKLCNREDNCQAAIFVDTTCSLYNSILGKTIGVDRQLDTVYLENVCSEYALDRPSYCSPPSPLAYDTYQDCQEYFENGHRTDGVYELAGSHLETFDAYCEFFNGHGWTVIQKRFDGSTDFYQNWETYKHGFGNPQGEYWLGNDRIHALTQTNKRLSIYLEAADGTSRNGFWSQFYVADESDMYRLTVSGDGYTGDAEEEFSQTHNGKMFSTWDRDNDEDPRNCARIYSGAWWNWACYSVNLNGNYSPTGRTAVQGIAIAWCCHWKGHSDSLMKTTMRVTRD